MASLHTNYFPVIQAYVEARGHRNGNPGAAPDPVTLNQMHAEAEVSGNAGVALWLAENVPGADIPRLQEVVLKSGDSAVALRFAAKVPTAEIAPLENLVVAKGTPWQTLEFAKRVEGASLRRLEDQILLTARTHPGAVFAFATEVDGAGFSRLKTALKRHAGPEADEKHTMTLKRFETAASRRDSTRRGSVLSESGMEDHQPARARGGMPVPLDMASFLERLEPFRNRREADDEPLAPRASA